MRKSRYPIVKVEVTSALLEDLQAAAAALRRTRGASRFAPSLNELILRMLHARQDHSFAKAATIHLPGPPVALDEAPVVAAKT